MLWALLSSALPGPTCQPDSDSLLVNYTLPHPSKWDLHYVSIATSSRPAQPVGIVTTRSFPVLVAGLHPGSSYVVTVRSHPKALPTIAWGPGWSPPSTASVCNTTAAFARHQPMVVTNPRTAPLSRFLRVYRISEYAFEPDFLENHDAADDQSMPLYLMTCDPMGNCAPWSTAELTSRWASCQHALESLCPGDRGAAFGCMSCADTHRAAVEAACGAWSDDDTMAGEGSFGVHWYCGVGWPESVAEEGPITEYCIEYLPNLAAGDGFAGYLSCNSDEVDALGNDPRNPRLSVMPPSLADMTRSHPITPHPVPSHPTPSRSHPIPSHPVPSHPIPSRPIPAASASAMTIGSSLTKPSRSCKRIASSASYPGSTRQSATAPALARLSQAVATRP